MSEQHYQMATVVDETVSSERRVALEKPSLLQVGETFRVRTRGDCSLRVVRGGAWTSFPGLLRAADRYRDAADNRNVILGFRVVRTLAP